ncbi:MAG: hypothetical protein ACTH31_11460, partial [Pseudoclavibacter sp.]
LCLCLCLAAADTHGAHPARSLTRSPQALAVLSKQRWPGNISRFRRVPPTSAMRAPAGEIRLEVIPPAALVDAPRRAE